MRPHCSRAQATASLTACRVGDVDGRVQDLGAEVGEAVQVAVDLGGLLQRRQGLLDGDRRDAFALGLHAPRSGGFLGFPARGVEGGPFGGLGGDLGAAQQEELGLLRRERGQQLDGDALRAAGDDEALAGDLGDAVGQRLRGDLDDGAHAVGAEARPRCAGRPWSARA